MLRRRLEVVIGTPFTEGNPIEVLRNGDQIFPAMLEAIRGAEATVDLMTFVYWQGDIARGVRRGDVANGPGPGSGSGCSSTPSAAG